MQRAAFAVLMLLSAACTTPPARIDSSRLYDPPRQALAVSVDDSLTLAAADGRPVPLRLVYPQGEGTWPLILFSHGMFSSNDMYMPILEHWAASGYVVAAPNHLDAKALWQPKRNDDVEELSASRAADLALIMDSLDRVTAAVPALAGRVRPPPYAAAGHSMGTYIAMLQGGLRTRNPNTKAVIGYPDRRIGFIVMSSDPGKMALMPENLWTGAGVPTFMTTGTKDYGTSGKGRRPADYTMEMLPADAAADGRRFRVLLENGDHYYGGLVHRAPKDVAPDAEGLRIFLTLSTAFLDAFAKEDESALRYLRNVDVAAATARRASLTVE